jgi:hypothetical protein
MAERPYLLRPAIWAPLALTGGAVVVGNFHSAWALAAVPFIWLGSLCSAANFNLANGCLAMIAVVLGIVLAFWFKPIGLAIGIGAFSGWVLSGMEKAISLRPATDEEIAAIQQKRRK